MNPKWLAEFGPEYAVPHCIAKAEDVTDQSWHNEVCPHFWMRDALKRDGKTYRVEIWADHPEQSERETQGANRFWLSLAEVDAQDCYLANDEDRQLCESDDAEKIMRVARRLYNPAQPEEVAKAFADVLKEWLTPEQMRQAIERNRTEDIEGVCHSHDFCDANMAMEAALQKFDMEADAQSEELASVWGKAWDIAKRNTFWFSDVKPQTDFQRAREAAVAGGAKVGNPYPGRRGFLLVRVNLKAVSVSDFIRQYLPREGGAR